MLPRMALKGLTMALAVTSGLAVAPAAAPAQEMSEWGLWDGPRARRPIPRTPDPTDGRYEDRYSRQDDRYDRPRDVRRDEQWRDEDRDDGVDSGYENRRDQDDDDRDAYRPRERALEQNQDQDADRNAGGQLQADGGGRPGIVPVAPPKVVFGAGYPLGSIVIDTGARKLYFVTGPTTAFAYPIGVGRDGFSWTGTEKVSRIQDWPDWYPPADMRQRKPELPEKMLGGIRNPLGAKAIYLGNTLYRIHGTNDPKSIGKAESSGCFRMLNQNVLHLAALVQVGAQVTVVHSLRGGGVVAARPIARPIARSVARPRLVERDLPRRPWWNNRYYGERYDPYER